MYSSQKINLKKSYSRFNLKRRLRSESKTNIWILISDPTLVPVSQILDPDVESGIFSDLGSESRIRDPDPSWDPDIGSHRIWIHLTALVQTKIFSYNLLPKWQFCSSLRQYL